MSITQEGRQLSISTPLEQDFLLIKRLRARESLSNLFRIDVELLHEEDEIGFNPTLVDPSEVLGQPMTVSVKQVDDTERFFSGICIEFTQGNRNERFSKYHAVLAPRVWQLTQVRQARIFQNISVPNILRKVFEGFEVEFEIEGNFEPRNYCVQYRESDFDFASRLMEEEGIYYYFEHTADTHKMIVANSAQSHRVCPSKSEIPFVTNISELEEWVGGIYVWRVDNKTLTGKYTLWDHNFELPTSNLSAEQPSRFDIGGNRELEFYDYPGGYARRFDGVDRGGGDQSGNLQRVFEDRQRTVRLRQEELDFNYKNNLAHSNCCALTAGYRFNLTTHPNSDNNINHLVVNAAHEAVQTPDYASGDAVDNAYSVSLLCIPHGGGHAPYRPLSKTRKPTVQGCQTAVVVGPAGEEIFTDKYGRVKVQFHWDRQGERNSGSSCWMRVAQSWAGNRWGTMLIPRIGMEVIVHFLEGDPDQPIITGCVYNPQTMPPYILPDEKTKSTIKSNSTKGGGGFNELRFEDKKGSEQIFIHAEKNQDIRVKNDCMETIVHDRHLYVGNDQYEKVRKDKHASVLGDHSEKVEGAMSLKVGSDLQEKVGKDYALDAQNEIHLKAGVTAVIEAGTSLTLKVGGNFVNISPAGVAISGTMVLINSGGAAGSGSGSSPNAPKDPKEAEKPK
jgi:type VI secretion system secreted protein VgrG